MIASDEAALTDEAIKNKRGSNFSYILLNEIQTMFSQLLQSNHRGNSQWFCKMLMS